MKIDIIHSSIDIAGLNIRAAMDNFIQTPMEEGWPLLDKHTVTFREWNERIINVNDAFISPDADIVIFLSRHTSVNPVPVLTVHSVGNFTSADLGGTPHELGLATPEWMHAVLHNLLQYAPAGFRVSYEITHHGPTNIPVPSFFVEVGSTEAEWRNMEATRAVAKSVLMAVPEEKIISLIGFGGTHYAARQTAIALETRGAFGHIMHTRNIVCSDPSMIRQMIEKSSAVAAYIDKKAMSKFELSHIKNLLRELSIPEVLEGDLHKIGTMSWELWTRFLSIARDIDPTAKLFPHGYVDVGTGEPVAIVLPDEFFNAAFGGREAVLFAELDLIGGVFHVTSNNGKVLPIILTTTSRRRDVAGDLIGLSIQQITRTNDTSVDGDQIIITRQKFDAQLARMHGVPNGPLFGKLVSGESVTLPDGKLVTLEMVTKTVQSIIHIPELENYS
ncbi:MAG TPA: D-tyrosyl-tRNA(Tyr) deacylase [Methanocorpusculum sp.]|nr:D-tyrosyl-tRNA(Tyr) deacylase [Methanocorpusculum sp.]